MKIDKKNRRWHKSIFLYLTHERNSVIEKQHIQYNTNQMKKKTSNTNKPVKIALIAPPYPLSEFPSPPLGICYVAAACERAGAKVQLFDFIISEYSQKNLKKALDDFQPDIVGASSVTMNFPKTADILKTVKKIHPHVITLMGGPHVSFDYENVLRLTPEIDIVVIGESEKTLLSLIPNIFNRSRWQTIPGIAFYEKDMVVITQEQSLIDNLDDLPLPARHLLNIPKYHTLGFPISIITSRGCPNRCIFCQGRRMVGQKVRYRSLNNVVDEIEILLGMGFDLINIADDLFTANKKRVIQFCEIIKDRKLSFVWSAFSRVNTVDPEILSMMKSAGCYAVSFGIESGNPEMLKRIQKGITREQARYASKCCKESGIRTHASFMVGLPGETHETLNDTLEFAESLGIEYGFHFLSPFPGTTLRENINDYDLEIITNDWEKYDANQAIVKTSSLSPEDIDTFVANWSKEQNDIWESQLKAYQKGETLAPHEQANVEEYHKRRFIFWLLSENLIEKKGKLNLQTENPFDNLCERISQHVSQKVSLMDIEFVKKHLKPLVEKKYIKCVINQSGNIWQWCD
ncbi:radical SAM domain-containing protein [Candidatus Magnetomorum sp. HK-1]|nr:radical SAM domain-containing protein [Candidatus Magnetomorum sp. HK-1]